MPYTHRALIKRWFLANIASGSHIIDAGCGRGELALAIARREATCSVVGIDTDIKKVRQAQTRFRRAGRGRALRCQRCPAEQLTKRFSRATYDIAVSCHALHHYQDSPLALRQIRTVLRKGGYFLLAELTPAYGERCDDCPRYSRRKISSLLTQAGFTIEQLVQKQPGVILVRARK